MTKLHLASASHLTHVPLSIRPMERADSARVLQMIDALTRHNGDRMSLDEASLIDMIYAPSPWARILVAENHGNIVGYAALVGGLQLQFGLRTMDLHHLYVDDAQRGMGIGRALIEAARETARNLDCVQLTVGTHAENKPAQAAYLACGFAPLAPRGPRFVMALS